MKLSELESERDPVTTDPCRMLPAMLDGTPGMDHHDITPYWDGVTHIRLLPDHSILVVDDETGLICQQAMRRDGHLGAVTDDC